MPALDEHQINVAVGEGCCAASHTGVVTSAAHNVEGDGALTGPVACR